MTFVLLAINDTIKTIKKIVALIKNKVAAVFKFFILIFQLSTES